MENAIILYTIVDTKLAKYLANQSENFSVPCFGVLGNLILSFSKLFDYVIIDAPPNYEQSIFSKEAVIAADCILPIQLRHYDSGYNSAQSILLFLRQPQPLGERANDDCSTVLGFGR